MLAGFSGWAAPNFQTDGIISGATWWDSDSVVVSAPRPRIKGPASPPRPSEGWAQSLEGSSGQDQGSGLRMGLRGLLCLLYVALTKTEIFLESFPPASHRDDISLSIP